MVRKNSQMIFVIVLLLSLLFPTIGQADPTLVDVYINQTLKYSSDPVYLTATALYSDGSTKDVTYSGTWESDRTSIATVYRGKVEFGSNTGNVTITFSYGGFADSVGTEVVDITDLAITTTNLKYSPKPVQLKVEGRYNNGELEEIDNRDVTWFSSNTSVATVDNDGIVTFRDNSGVATIGVIFTSPLTNQVIRDEIEVTVSDEDIDEEDDDESKAYTLKIDGKLDPSKKTSTLKAYKLYIDDSKKNLSNDLISWSSSNPYIAEVDSTGKVTFTGKPGKVIITAEYRGRTASVDAFVPYELNELIINESLNFTPYFFQHPPRLTVTGKDNSGKTQLVYNVEWSSSNEELASIDNQGQITFTGKPGEVTFSATKDDLTAEITSTIPDNQAKKLRKVFIEKNLFYSEKPQELKALALYSNGSIEDITKKVRWSSSNEAIATIKNNKVYFSGLSGSVEISCSYQGLSNKVKTLVSVPGKQRVLNSIKFLDTFLTYADHGKELKVYGIYTDNSKKPLNFVKFHSFQPNIVKVKNNKVYFTGIPGQGTIEAVSGDFRSTIEVEVIDVAGSNLPVLLKINGDLDNYQKTKNLKAFAVYPNGNQVEITEEATWNTTNRNIAKILDKGKVEFIGNGPVRISGAFNNQIVYLSNKAYYQFGNIHPLKTDIISLTKIKDFTQDKLAKNSFIPIPYDIYGHWARKDIHLARRLGWMGGYPDGSMRPDNPISRGEFASLIQRALLLQTENRYVKFTDLKNHWAKESININANLGLIPLEANGKFRPNDPLTREEMAQILANLIKVRIDTNYYYLDVPPASPSAAAIAQVTQAGIMSGMDQLYFKPQEPATRAQALVVLLRLLKTDPEMEGILKRAQM